MPGKLVLGVPNLLSHKFDSLGVPCHLARRLVTLSGDIDGRDRSWICNSSTFGKPRLCVHVVVSQARHVFGCQEFAA